MRCLACQKRLNDRESVRKYPSTSEYIDLCDKCFSTIADDLPDIDEGEYPEDLPEDLPEDEEKDGGWDYQQRNNHGGE